MLRGHLTLSADQTYSLAFDLRVTRGASVTTATESSTGVYESSGNTFALTSKNGDVDTGSIVGPIMTVSAGGTVFVFQI